MKFIVLKNSNGEWMWHCKARNGRVLCDSGESYKSKAMAIKRMAAVIIAAREQKYTLVVPK